MTLNTETAIELSICEDCLMVLANGAETAEQETAAAAMVAKWGDTVITLGSLECDACRGEDGACEPWFSWRWCEGCGSQLGGNREHATAWVRGEGDKS
jgi:hypothetical protein